MEDYTENAIERKGQCGPKAKTSYTYEDKVTLTYLCYSPANVLKFKWAKRDCSKQTVEALKNECEIAQGLKSVSAIDANANEKKIEEL